MHSWTPFFLAWLHPLTSNVQFTFLLRDPVDCDPPWSKHFSNQFNPHFWEPPRDCGGTSLSSSWWALHPPNPRCRCPIQRKGEPQAEWGWNLCKNCGTSWSNAHIYTCYTVILCYTIPSHTILYTVHVYIQYVNHYQLCQWNVSTNERCTLFLVLFRSVPFIKAVGSSVTWGIQPPKMKMQWEMIWEIQQLNGYIWSYIYI